MANPFNIILDEYAEGSENAYMYLLRKGKGEFPSLVSGLSMIKQTLLKSSFAYLCVDYVVNVKRCYRMEDFELFVEEMNFVKYIDEIFYLFGEEQIKWEYGIYDMEDADEISKKRFNEMLEELLIKYYDFWKKLLSNHFKSDMEIHNYFCDVVLEGESMNFEEESQSLGFVQELCN